MYVGIREILFKGNCATLLFRGICLQVRQEDKAKLGSASTRRRETRVSFVACALHTNVCMTRMHIVVYIVDQLVCIIITRSCMYIIWPSAHCTVEGMLNAVSMLKSVCLALLQE